MKTLFAILMLTSVMAQSAVLGDNDILGKYYDESGAQVAKVFRSNGKLKIQFQDACTAELSLFDNAWTGVCTTGSGYGQESYQVKNITLSGEAAVLQAKTSQYADAEFGDDGSFTATKR